MWKFPKRFGVIVIGGGHAGVEAAHAAAKMGVPTLLLTQNLDTIGKMSCNPSIGGTAKGHIVREIDALGGLMGKVADRTSLQSRMLNASKGPAVHSPRAQADKAAYALEMKKRLEETPLLEIQQGTTVSFQVREGKIEGVLTQEGIFYEGETVVLSSGTFLRGLLHIGQAKFSGGRGGDAASMGLSPCLEALGFRLGRLKTGTPPRIHRRSIDFSRCEEQLGSDDVVFSFDAKEPKIGQIPCHITYTTPQTNEIIRRNLDRSPLFDGTIQGVGPRYCPSIEDKVVRFPQKETHQIFLEPEGLWTHEIYVNGLSSSLPFDVQMEVLQSVEGLEKGEILRPAYAIEYDFLQSDQVRLTLETKLVEGLFVAGQINGTTGYEEAAGQGLWAGINAACKVLQKPPFLLTRAEGYLGVLVDDLLRFDLEEPYRMFTSRAEHRLLLRQDNADLRLRKKGYALGLLSKAQYDRVCEKEEILQREQDRLQKTYLSIEGRSTSLFQLLARPDWTYARAKEEFPAKFPHFGEEIEQLLERECAYMGYIERQKKEVEKLSHLEGIFLPRAIDYEKIQGLRTEAKQKLLRFQPETLGQASRIPGVTPSDLSVLAIAIKKPPSSWSSS